MNELLDLLIDLEKDYPTENDDVCYSKRLNESTVELALRHTIHEVSTDFGCGYLAEDCKVFAAVFWRCELAKYRLSLTVTPGAEGEDAITEVTVRRPDRNIVYAASGYWPGETALEAYLLARDVTVPE